MAWDAASIIDQAGLVREAECQGAHGQHHPAAPITGWIGTSAFGTYVRCPELHRLDQDHVAMRPRRARQGARVHARWSRRARFKALYAKAFWFVVAAAVVAVAVAAWLAWGGP